MLLEFPDRANCCRCGQDFVRYGLQRVCPECRKKPELAPKATREGQKLSFREQQVVGLVRQAKLNKEIAHKLHLSEGTIKEYLNRIFRKVNVTNRTELAIWAVKQNVG